MSNKLLTKVLTAMVNEYAQPDNYGVSLITIPDFDYSEFAKGLISADRRIEIFFLGFSKEKSEELNNTLPSNDERISYGFSVEEAETSRNSGDENIFRVFVIKRTELEKTSSLRWFPEIILEKVYIKSCDMVKKELSNTNAVIDALLKALKSKQIRNILNFERVINYFELLLAADENQLPSVIKDKFYLLGLCSDKNIDSGNPGKDDLIYRIKRNHEIVERIGGLEQAERQSITNYYSKENIDKEIPGLILKYYSTHSIDLLKHMDVDDVEKCLKAVKKATTVKPRKDKGARIKPTALAAQLVFDGSSEQIDNVLEHITQNMDDEEKKKKAENVDIDINDIKLQVKREPITESIAVEMTDDDNFGGVIYAEVQSPSEAIRDSGKYEPELFKKPYLDVVWSSLSKIATMLPDGETISGKLKKLLEVRSKIVPYRKRLQDAPMLQVLSKYSDFAEYLDAYNKLLEAINEEFSKIWSLSPSKAKEIINTVMSLDYVYIIGETKHHAIPTPLHPLYLWKYVELAKEILSSKGVSEIEEGHLNEDDKAFIIRKAEDIPDPLSVILLPVTILSKGAIFLPLSGRLGMLPIYSNQPQINQSESGVDTLKQQIIRYLCLYPHAGMMLKLAVIDPPSVEVVVSMLKALNSDKEFNIGGIELSVYRTKEVPNDWVEIEDESLNDGMLGKIKGKRSLNFKIKIADKRRSYSKILEEINKQHHLIVVFDPNEVKIETAQNSRYLHIHPLCVPKIYKYDPVDERVDIRPASEGGIFTVYSSIIEKLNEQPSSFSHTSTVFHTPLKRETYDSFLEKADWLIILDQSLKNWDISLRAASEKLFYKENNYRSVGVYSNNCKKFIVGYDTLIKELGNFIPKQDGVKNVIEMIREINDDGLLSIVSHTSNRIFDMRHGKGSLGTAIAAIKYRRQYPNAFIVGLDTQLAQEWLSEREDGKLPDLIGIRFENDQNAMVDIIEVKTYSNSPNSFIISDNIIKGHAVEQAAILEGLIKEMFGKTERITTVSRREILREQIFECLFHAMIEPREKLEYCNLLNELFAGEFAVTVNKNIAFVDFEGMDSNKASYKGENEYAGDSFNLITIGGKEIQAILAGVEYEEASIVNPPPIEEKEHCCGNSMMKNEGKVIVEEKREEIASKENQAPLSQATERDEKAIAEKCARLNKVFRDYNINAFPVKAEDVQEAARFTRFPVELKSGETIRSLERCKRDIGIQLEANGEILINHIKGTKYISVDVPFVSSGKPISLLENLELTKSKEGALNIVAGQKPDGKIEVMDISKAPHMLIAGTTGSGKTIFLHSILVSLLYQYSPDELEVLIIDPKQTDFVFYEGIAHLYGGHVVDDAEEALEKILLINTEEKEKRTAALKSCRARDIDSYNQKCPDAKMKRFVVVIDEYSDLIQAAEMQGNRKDFEQNLLMLLQRVRNLGIHIIIATQRPSAQIVTGSLKAVIPFRVSFRLPSHTDSQTILDMSGAEDLLGKGDMLMVTDNDIIRMQGLYISEDELSDFVEKL